MTTSVVDIVNHVNSDKIYGEKQNNVDLTVPHYFPGDSGSVKTQV